MSTVVVSHAQGLSGVLQTALISQYYRHKVMLHVYGSNIRVFKGIHLYQEVYKRLPPLHRNIKLV